MFKKKFLKEMETIVHFLDWTFAVNKELTESVYANVFKGGAEGCGCSMCRNYIQYREHIFPNEVKELLLKIGIDITKDFDITHFAQTEPHLHLYGGWFNFAGKILKGKESRIPLPNSGFTNDLTEINPYFSIGFDAIEDSTSTFFKEIETPIVQVEISFKMPWVISEEEPD